MEAEIAKLNTEIGVTVKDIPPQDFIKAFAAHLKKGGKFKIPEWASLVKTGCAKELAPYDVDWLYFRAASVARQVYMRRKVGLTSLRDHYGQRMRFGVCKEHHVRSGGKVIRYCLQQLANIGLVGVVQIKDEDDKNIIQTEGRTITRSGIKDMDTIATKIVKDIRRK